MPDYLAAEEWKKIRTILLRGWSARSRAMAFRILRLHDEAGNSRSLRTELHTLLAVVQRLKTEEEIMNFLSARYLKAMRMREVATKTRTAKPPKPAGSRIATPPGMHLRAFADAVYSAKTRRLVLEPTLRDLYDEYCEALIEGRTWKARWARARGYWSFWSAVVAQLPVSLARKLLDIWKAVS